MKAWLAWSLAGYLLLVVVFAVGRFDAFIPALGLGALCALINRARS